MQKGRPITRFTRHLIHPDAPQEASAPRERKSLTSIAMTARVAKISAASSALTTAELIPVVLR
ncbi:MAG: hypothetical protein V1924_01135 [Candidatus Bathyarchaeota archaeon]